MDEKEPWKASAAWEFPLGAGQLELSASGCASRPADQGGLRWGFSSTGWDFYTRTDGWLDESLGTFKAWDQELGAEWKSRKFVAGLMAGGGWDEDQWTARGRLQGEGSGLFIPGRFILRLQAQGVLAESPWTMAYTALLEWKAPEDRARFSMEWKREPRPWGEAPRVELNGVYTETSLSLELRW